MPIGLNPNFIAWTGIEICVLVLSACLPRYRRLLQLGFKHLISMRAMGSDRELRDGEEQKRQAANVDVSADKTGTRESTMSNLRN